MGCSSRGRQELSRAEQAALILSWTGTYFFSHDMRTDACSSPDLMWKTLRFLLLNIELAICF